MININKNLHYKYLVKRNLCRILPVLLAFAIFIIYMPLSGSAAGETVTVGGQVGALYAGTAGTVTFPVTTTGITDGDYAAAVTNLPTGVTVQGQVSIYNNSGTLTLAGDTSTVAGVTNTLTMTIDTVTSGSFSVTVTAAPVCEILDAGNTVIGQYATLDAALAAVASGQTIRLLGTIYHTAQIDINGISVTLKTNGYMLDVNTASGWGLYVHSGGQLLLDDSGGGQFNVASSDRQGAYIMGANSAATVTNAGSTGSNGAAVEDGSLTVLGNATSSSGHGVYAYGSGSSVTVLGNVTGGYYGVNVQNGGSVTVYGDVILTGASSTNYGVYVSSSLGSYVTVDGVITVPAGATYINLGGSIKTAAGYEATTTKPGYLTYTDGTHTVWVKAAAPALTTGAATRISDADATVKFISDMAGTYYWQLDGTALADAAALVTAGPNATVLSTAEQTITLSTLTAGAHTIYIAAKNSMDSVSNLLAITIPVYTPPATYPLTVSAGPGGSVSGTPGGNYAAGTSISITATANSGYNFKGWTVSGATITGGNAANPATFFMPAGSVTVTANWTYIGGGSGGSGSGGGGATGNGGTGGGGGGNGGSGTSGSTGGGDGSPAGTNDIAGTADNSDTNSGKTGNDGNTDTGSVRGKDGAAAGSNTIGDGETPRVSGGDGKAADFPWWIFAVIAAAIIIIVFFRLRRPQEE